MVIAGNGYGDASHAWRRALCIEHCNEGWAGWKSEMTMRDEQVSKAMSELAQQYLAIIKEKFKRYAPSLEKMIKGTLVFRGTAQKLEVKAAAQAFLLWVLVMDTTGASEHFEGTPFLPMFDPVMAEIVDVDPVQYLRWCIRARRWLAEVRESYIGQKPKDHPINVFFDIYSYFDKSFSYRPERKMVLNAFEMMAREICSSSVLQEMTPLGEKGQ